MKTSFQKFSKTLACGGFVLYFSATIALGGTVAFNYDLTGRLTQSGFAGNKSINYTYDSAGNLLQRAIDTGGSGPDSDGDGMDDAWEIHHFGSKESRDGTLDFDNDGFSDLNEFLAGTLPKDEDSALQVIPTPLITGGGATVEWQAVSGKTYRLQFKNSLSDANWTNVSGDVTANSAVGSKSDPTASGQQRRFYRVLLIP